MARFTLRIPDEMKQEMEELEQVNWSEYVRKSIEERLGGPKHREIKRLVQREEYQSDVERLWILHMFSEKVDEKYLYETAELVFGEEKDDLVEEVLNDLEEESIQRPYDKLDDGQSVGETIGSEIDSAGISKIMEETRRKVSDASREVKNGISLLIHYLDTSSDKGFLYPRGFERTWSIYSDGEVDVNEIIATGMAYRGHYSSNAYSHRNDRVPNYAIEMLEDVVDGSSDVYIPYTTPSTSDIRNIVEEDEYLEFLKWMEGTSKFVNVYDEKENIEQELEERGMEIDWERFVEIRNELIRDDILIIDCSPHRSSTGGRSSRPARWKYELTAPAVDRLPNLLLERIGEI